MKIRGVLEAQWYLLCALSLLTTNFADSGRGFQRHRRRSNRNSGYNMGEILSDHAVISLLQCEDLCLRRQPQCLGYNYHFCEEEEKLCELLKSIGKTQPNRCVKYVKFHHGQVQKRLLQGCTCSRRARPIK